MADNITVLFISVITQQLHNLLNFRGNFRSLRRSFRSSNKLLYFLGLHDDIRCVGNIQPYVTYIVEHFGDLIEKAINALGNIAPQIQQTLGKKKIA